MARTKHNTARQWMFTSIFLLASGATAAEMSFKTTLQYALDHSPTLNTATRQLEIAEWDTKNTQAKLLPSVDVSADHGLQWNSPPNPTDPYLSRASLTLQENIYDNGISLLQYRKANTNLDIARTSQERARQQLLLDVSEAFYQYSLSRVTSEARQSQYESLKKQFSSVADQYFQGLKSRADYLRLKTQVERARLSWVVSSADYSNSEVALKKMMGVPEVERTGIQLVALDPDQLQNDIPAVYFSPEKTFDYRIAKLGEKTADIDVQVSKRDYWPQIKVGTGMQYGAANYLGTGQRFNDLDNLGWNLTLTLSYNIWDWGLRRRNVAISENNRSIQLNRIQAALLDARAQIDTLANNVRQLQESLSVSKELMKLEQENYTLIKRNYQEGKAQYLDLIQSFDNLLSARLSFYSASYNLAEAAARYRFLEGTLYDWLLGNSR